MAVLVGVDVGTTNWKVGAFNEEGRLLCLETTPTVIRREQDGVAYYDPNEIWNSVAGLIRKVVASVADHGTADAIAVTGMGEAVVAVDSSGAAVGRIVPWFDTRSAPQASTVLGQLGARRIFTTTGLECNPIFTLPKIMWIRDEQPETYNRAVHWLSVVDFVNLKLSGVPFTDYTEASRTLMLDLSTNSWADEMVEFAGIPRTSLPDIRQSGTPVGPLAPEAARDTGLPAGTQVVVGGHDHLCGSLAAGVLLGPRVLDSSGTAESIVGFSDLDQSPPEDFQGLRLGRHLDPRRFVTWGGIIASGRSLDWAVDTVASLEVWGRGNTRIPYDEVNEAIASISLGSDGLLYVPHLRGCGAPHWEPRARGAFVGLRDVHTPAHCLRAVVEGLCFEARTIVDLTEEVFGSPVDTLSTIGGGTRSAIWQQIKADTTGRTVEVPEVQEATIQGAALLAGVGIGVYNDLVDASSRTYRAEVRYVPDSERMDMFRARYEIYRQLYDALLPVNVQIDELEKGE